MRFRRKNRIWCNKNSAVAVKMPKEPRFQGFGLVSIILIANHVY
jgi:hypothetical protein